MGRGWKGRGGEREGLDPLVPPVSTKICLASRCMSFDNRTGAIAKLSSQRVLSAWSVLSRGSGLVSVPVLEILSGCAE